MRVGMQHVFTDSCQLGRTQASAVSQSSPRPHSKCNHYHTFFRSRHAMFALGWAPCRAISTGRGIPLLYMVCATSGNWTCLSGTVPCVWAKTLCKVTSEGPGAWVLGNTESNNIRRGLVVKRGEIITTRPIAPGWGSRSASCLRCPVLALAHISDQRM